MRKEREHRRQVYSFLDFESRLFFLVSCRLSSKERRRRVDRVVEMPTLFGTVELACLNFLLANTKKKKKNLMEGTLETRLSRDE